MQIYESKRTLLYLLHSICLLVLSLLCFPFHSPFHLLHLLLTINTDPLQHQTQHSDEAPDSTDPAVSPSSFLFLTLFYSRLVHRQPPPPGQEGVKSRKLRQSPPTMLTRSYGVSKYTLLTYFHNSFHFKHYKPTTTTHQSPVQWISAPDRTLAVPTVGTSVSLDWC